MLWLRAGVNDDPRQVGLKAALCGRCVSSERVDNDLELSADLDDGVLYKDKKLKDQVEVAIGDGMEFTIPGKFYAHNYYPAIKIFIFSWALKHSY